MKKLELLALAAVAAGILSLASVPQNAQAADAACVTKDFKTEMIKQACTKGGQAEAKDTMKKFAKEKGIKECKSCHSSLSPDYKLTPDGLEKFKKLGGK